VKNLARTIRLDVSDANVFPVAAEQFEAAVEPLATHLFQAYGAPGLLDAMAAARQEIEDMATLSAAHPVGALLAIERALDNQSITERTRVVEAPSEEFHARIWALEDDETHG